MSVFLVQTFLSRLAAETGGHFHEFTSTIHEDEKVSQHFVPCRNCVCMYNVPIWLLQSYTVVDTNIIGLEEEIKR